MDDECPGGPPYIIVYTVIMVNWQLSRFIRPFVIFRRGSVAGIGPEALGRVRLRPNRSLAASHSLGDPFRIVHSRRPR